MVQEAAANQSADEKRKEEVDLTNQAQTYIYDIDKMLTETQKDENAQAATQIAEMQKMRDDLQKSLEAKNFTELKAKLEQLQQAFAAAQQFMQQQGQSGVQSEDKSDATDFPKNSDDVIDVEAEKK